ncbi:MAG: 2'-5' RNA ligase family protein [Arachnia sp.]
MAAVHGTTLGEPRYGVFLRPDPATCLIQSQINTVLVQQFGIVSAAAFPPHATLVGSLRTRAQPPELMSSVDRALAPVDRFTVYNSGIASSNGGWAYNVNDGPDGQPNQALHELASRVMAALLPLALDAEDSHTERIDSDSFRAHLSLASHDLLVEPRLKGEVGEFLKGLPLEPPATFLAQTVSLYEFTTDDWRGQWWHALSWRQLRSWQLGSGS